MLVHPRRTALDLVAPQLISAAMGDVDTQRIWKELSPVTTDRGWKIVPSTTFADASANPDILRVPRPQGLKAVQPLKLSPA